MRLEELFETPDFGYKHFVNRDEDINNLIWNVEKENGPNQLEAIKVRVLSNDGKHQEGVIIARRQDDKFQITRSQLTQYKPNKPNWSSTGLGQMMYDRMISEVKKAGFRYLISDYKMSVEARKAWKKLATRYPVTNEVDIFDGEKYRCFQIDLDKVK